MKKEYNEWIKRIAKDRPVDELISHFREHVWNHYERHKRDEDSLSMKIWIIGCLNFLNILKEKFSDITTEDLLFKLATYYKSKKKGPEPPFDVDEFLRNYRGEIKKYHKHAIDL